MFVFTFVSLFIAVLSASDFENPEFSNELKWHETPTLTWDNFKARPQRYADHHALTTWGISYSATFDNRGKIEAEVYCFFDERKSWVKKDGSQYLLRHEQLHFDLGEVYARKMRKELSEFEFSYRTFNSDLQKIYNDHMNACTREQSRYDRETDHSLKREKQKQWDEKITRQLRELEEFSSPIVEIYY